MLDLFDHLVTVGWIEDDVPVGGPLRVPVWDYEAVPVGGPDRGNPHALDEWEQLAWVETWNGLTIPDPQDDRRFTVPYTLRLSWQATSRAPVPAPIAAKFGGVWAGVPPWESAPSPPDVPPGPVPVPLVPVIQGPAGPIGPPGPEGPPGGAMVSGWWDYDFATIPPVAAGHVRTTDAVVGGPMTIYLAARDDAGLYWADAVIKPGDEVRLRGSGGTIQHAEVTDFTVSVEGPEGYGTVETVLTASTGAITKNAKVEVALIREP